MSRAWSKANGYSLLEMVVVLGIIAAMINVGLACLVRVLPKANESTAIATLRTLAEQQRIYFLNHQRNAYGTFDELLKDGLLDSRFSDVNPKVNGYIYSIDVIEQRIDGSPTYRINADPQVRYGIFATGRNSFYADSESTTIHINPLKPATVSDPPVGK